MAPLFLVQKKVTAEAPPSKTYTLLTSVHNDADTTDDANDYNRVIGITQLKDFSCAKKNSFHLVFNMASLCLRKMYCII